MNHLVLPSCPLSERMGSPRPAQLLGMASLCKLLRVDAHRYRELVHSRRCSLLVAAVEVGGRWDPEAYRFLTQLAKAKARSAPQVLQRPLASS